MRRPLFNFSMFCKAIYTMWRPLFSFKYVLQSNLYYAATSVQFQVCFARQSIQCGDLCSILVCFARQSIQCGDLCSVSSMFCKAIYTVRRHLFSSSMFCKAIYTMWRPLFSFKYILQGNLYNVAISVQFQVCFARQSIQCGDLCSVQV